MEEWRGPRGCQLRSEPSFSEDDLMEWTAVHGEGDPKLPIGLIRALSIQYLEYDIIQMVCF